MFKIDTPNAVNPMPAPRPARDPGWFAHGDPATATPYTTLSADWANAVQAEISNVVTAAGMALNKFDQTQLLKAIPLLRDPHTRIILTADVGIYVSTTGNDVTGNGTAAAPLASVGAAWNLLATHYDGNGHNGYIQLLAGIYNTTSWQSAVPMFGFSSIQIYGNVSVPSSVVISTLDGYCLAFNNTGCMVGVHGISFTAGGVSTSTTTAGYGIISGYLSWVIIDSCVFGMCSSAHMAAGNGGMITTQGYSYTISGSAPVHMTVGQFGAIWLRLSTITLVGSPNFSTSFAWCGDHGYINTLNVLYNPLTAADSTHGATGTRYICATNSVINTGGGGASHFPGSLAGIAITGGQYV